MNVLVACEESQRVCKAFRARGHRAFSCDIVECSGGRPDWHIQGDVIPLLNGNCEFTLQNGQTDRQMGLDHRSSALYGPVRERGKMVRGEAEGLPAAESSRLFHALCPRKLRQDLHREPGRDHEQMLQETRPDYSAVDVW